MPNLKTLRLNRAFQTNNTLPDLKQIEEEAQNFVKGFEDLKHLIALDLKVLFDFPEDEAKQFLQSLFKNLASLKNLESLKLDLDTYYYPSEYSAYENIFLFKSLTRLHKLSFSLSDDTENPEGNYVPLRLFFQAFGSLPSLKNFALDLFCREISSIDMSALAQMFQGWTCLENLSLKINEECFQDGSLNLLSKSLTHLKLSSFNLNVNGFSPDTFFLRGLNNENDIEGMSLLFSTLSNFTSLSTLKLKLCEFVLSPNEIEELSVLLKGLKQLTHLSLEFGHKRVKNLLFALKELKNLTSLKLILHGTITDEEALILASSFEDLSPNLEHLDLQLQWAERIQNQGKKGKKGKKAPQDPQVLQALRDLQASQALRTFQALEKGLESLRSLRYLSLVFEKLGEETVFLLLKAFKFLKNLETVIFATPLKVRMGDSGKFLRELGGHWNLKTLEIKRGYTTELSL